MKLGEAFKSRYLRLVERSENWGKKPPDKDELWDKVSTCYLEGFKCCYCGCQMLMHQSYPSFEVFSLDHYVPFAAGGDNVVSNIVVCCHTCNIIKGTMSGDTFKELLKYIPVELKKKMFVEVWKGRLADKLGRVKAEAGYEKHDKFELPAPEG